MFLASAETILGEAVVIIIEGILIMVGAGVANKLVTTKDVDVEAIIISTMVAEVGVAVVVGPLTSTHHMSPRMSGPR
jgi:hypothetical protein